MRSAGSLITRPSSMLVMISPSTICAASMPPRASRCSRIGSSGWRTPSTSMPNSRLKLPVSASSTFTSILPTLSASCGPKLASMLLCQPSAVSSGTRTATKWCHLRRRFLAAEHHHALAAGGFAVGHAHLHETVRAQRVECCRFGGDVTADEGDLAGGFDADELRLIGTVDAHAAIVEIQGQHVDHALPAKLVRRVQAAQAQHRGRGPFQHRGAWFRRVGHDRHDRRRRARAPAAGGAQPGRRRRHGALPVPG